MEFARAEPPHPQHRQPRALSRENRGLQQTVLTAVARRDVTNCHERDRRLPCLANWDAYHPPPRQSLAAPYLESAVWRVSQSPTAIVHSMHRGGKPAERNQTP